MVKRVCKFFETHIDQMRINKQVSWKSADESVVKEIGSKLILGYDSVNVLNGFEKMEQPSAEMCMALFKI